MGGSGEGSGILRLASSSLGRSSAVGADATVGDDGIGAVTIRVRDAGRRVGTPSINAAITGTESAGSQRDPPGGQSQQSGGSLPARIASAIALAASGPIGGPSIR